MRCLPVFFTTVEFYLPPHIRSRPEPFLKSTRFTPTAAGSSRTAAITAMHVIRQRKPVPAISSSRRKRHWHDSHRREHKSCASPFPRGNTAATSQRQEPANGCFRGAH